MPLLDWRAHLDGPSGPEPSGPEPSGPRPSGPRASGPRASGPEPTGPAVDVTAGGTLLRVYAERWSSEPAAASLYVASGEGDSADNRRWITAGELDERTRHAASGLLRLGLSRHARVLWNADRSLASVVACLAVMRAGLVLVPLDPKLTERELRHVVEEVRPDLAIVDDPGRAGLLAGMIAKAAGAVSVVGTSFGDTDRPGPPERSEPQEGVDDAGHDDPALIGFTSGTTGAPKGAVLTHANLLANAESLRLAWGWTTEDRLVHALPLFHGHGLCAALFGTLNAGGSAVLLGGFDSGAVVDAIDEHRGTLFFGVPTMYHRFASSGHASGLGRLRLAVSGSAPLPPEMHREIERASGMSVLERYGMTETLLTVSNPLHGERRPGSIGFPLPGTDVVLSRTDEGSEGVDEASGSAHGVEGGELLVRGPDRVRRLLREARSDRGAVQGGVVLDG